MRTHITLRKHKDDCAPSYPAFGTGWKTTILIFNPGWNTYIKPYTAGTEFPPLPLPHTMLISDFVQPQTYPSLSGTASNDTKKWTFWTLHILYELAPILSLE